VHDTATISPAGGEQYRTDIGYSYQHFSRYTPEGMGLMKRVIKVVSIVFAVVCVLAVGLLAYLFIFLPNAGPVEQISIERTPARLIRGEYLAKHVAVCVDCHSTRNWALFSGPIVPGTEGKGGERFDALIGLPGVVYAKNITPAALGNVSDGAVLHAIAGGIDHNGKPLFPLMGYTNLAKMSREDLYSIIAYLRTLPPVENTVPEHQLDFPLNLIVRTIPAPYPPQSEPNRSNAYEYGKYLVNAAGCIDCHTPKANGRDIEGMEYAGGWEISLPEGTIRSANITPEEETGIGQWTKEIFVAKFKEWENADTTKLSIARMGRQSIMPWTLYAGMTEEDLGAIYAYLRTVHPVKNRVETWTSHQPMAAQQ
jgi:mono/diheme cytochrome c family protein